VFSDDPALKHSRLTRVGSREPNLAIVRASWLEGEAPFLVLQRFGPGPAEIEARVQLDGGPETSQTVQLNADGEAPLSLRVGHEVQRIDVRLPGDAMTLDDRATLFRSHVREVQLDVTDTRVPLRAAFERAAAAIPKLRPVNNATADLRVTEAKASASETPTLVVTRDSDGKSALATGLQSDPFSPLMAAFDPRGLVWYAWQRQAPERAQVLLRSADQALIWREAAALTLNVDLERSNLLSHVAFPLFIDALVSEVDRAKGGLPRRSFALGESLSFVRGADTRGDVYVQRPSGERTTFSPGEPIELGVLSEPGIYALHSEARSESFTVLLQSAAESNLQARLPPSAPPQLSTRERPSAESRALWSSLLLLAALACACLAFTRLERRAVSS
jgi:hypothetical protein